jgi:hypothetical protein
MRSVIVVLLVAGALYLARGWWLPWLPQDWVERVREATVGEPASAPEPTPIYVWQNELGQWQYTDQPPADRPFEVRQYREDTNVVPSTGSSRD